MNKNSVKRCWHGFIAAIMLLVMIFSSTGCSVLDPLGISRGGSKGGQASEGDGNINFLTKKRVMKFFNMAPGDEINSLYTYLKAVINATYVGEIEIDTSKPNYETAAWQIMYDILNGYAPEDNDIKFKKKQGKFFISEELLLEYISSSFAGVDEDECKNIANTMNQYSTMVTYDSGKKEYTILSSDSAGFNAELINIKVKKKKVKVDDSMVDGAVLVYQLTDLAEERHNLGKVSVVIVKNEASRFKYSIAKTMYSKKNFGEPTVTVSPSALPTEAVE